MAFSFNWAGTNINQINPQISRQAYEDARNLGAAAAGARRMIGMQKYADLIRQASGGNASRIAEIQAEISRLEARNKELGELQAQAQAPTQPQTVSPFLAEQQAAQQMAGYAPNPGYIAQQQMNGYGAYQQGMQDQGVQAANLLPLIVAQQQNRGY